MFDLAVHLRQGLFAAHCQHGVAEADEENHQCELADPSPIEPAQRLLGECHHSWVQGIRRQLYHRRTEDGNRAPQNQNHHHHRGDGHDLQGLAAGFVNTLRILPPEIGHYHDG